MKIIDEIKDEFSRTEALALIPVAIGINYVGSTIARATQIPLYLDMIGTFFASMLAGPWIGATGGALYNIVFGLTVKPTYIPFALVNIVGGLVCGYLTIKGWFKTWPKTVVSAVILWLTALLTSTPISAYLFGGVTGGATSVLTATLLATGQQLLSATFWGSAPIEIADKFLSTFVAKIIASELPKRYASRFKYAGKVLKEG